MTEKQASKIEKPLQRRAFPAPDWMDRHEKKQFRAIIAQRLDGKCEITDAERHKIADYIAIRGRIEVMRYMMSKDQREIASGGQSTSTKSRMLQLARQMDAAERQSHQLAADLGLTSKG